MSVVLPTPPTVIPPRRVVFLAGGGTGGHLVPALAIAAELRARAPHLEPVLIGAQRGVESRLLPLRDFRYHLLPTEPIYRREWWRNWRQPVVLAQLARRLWRLFDVEGPAVVVGTGGYASGPVVWWAQRLGLPTAIQEQNAWPGVANRWLARGARHVYLGAPEARARLVPGARTQLIDTGNPITPPDPWRRVAAREKYGLSGGQSVLLVTGGSQGALAINRAVADWLRSGKGKRVQLLWVTGPGTYDEFRAFHAPPRVHVIPFLDQMAEAYAVADLVVSRAGMLTVAELCAWGLPSILIPLPTAAANHQEENAKALAAAGAAVHLPQATLTPDSLGNEIRRLLSDAAARRVLAEKALRRGKPDAARDIVTHILALLQAG
ncbi:MAG: undecaprenyldiphospho-muramoylpentapeptide beta-N-acetylglucosaminyltransferase [Gemmatimonadales bacterium]|nr:undecaprenyldiphospho-muramoylpentapeptide beta-N-acetylglucosaminyltransferase [Gemmatimonadales bacterium]